MIFVTVGTHEQPFDRLVRCVDELVRDGKIHEEVFIQTGYSTYEPKYCRWQSMIPFNEMDRNINEAHIVISHAGPSSFLAPIRAGKIPVVVPRMKKFGEHVNDHQLKFARVVYERQGSIILVEDVEKLAEVIAHYDETSADVKADLRSNNENFVREFEKVVEELMNK